MSFVFPDIPIKSMYKQCGNTVVITIVKEIARNIKMLLINRNGLNG